MSPDDRVLFEVLEAGEFLVAGYVSAKDSGHKYGISLPRFMCPEVACFPGGCFYVRTEIVSPEEERPALEKLFSNS